MNDLIERYRKLYAGVIYDALYFDLEHREPFVVDGSIGHLAGASLPVIGPAFTCWGIGTSSPESQDIHDSDLDPLRLEVFEAITPGSVMVIGSDDNECPVAIFGDVSALIAKTTGALGVIIDGYTRDLDRIDRMNLPLFGKGARPEDAYGNWFLWAHSEAIGLDGNGEIVGVAPNDLIFADRDGVLVIPQRLAADVLEAAEKRAQREEEIREAILGGERPTDIYRRLGRW